jgi:hypothetical protein
MRALALCALVACTYPEKQFYGPFTCLGAPPPTTAKPIVNITGNVVEPANSMPIAGASVAFQAGQMTTLFTKTTDASGGFSFTFNTNGLPADNLDLMVSASGHATTYDYPSLPVTDDIAAQPAPITTVEQAALAMGFGVQFDATHGAALLSIMDCNGAALDGAVVTASPSGTSHYFSGENPAPSATATDVGGLVLAAQLPAGPITLSTTVQGKQLPDRHFTVVGNTFIQTIIQP